MQLSDTLNREYAVPADIRSSYTPPTSYAPPTYPRSLPVSPLTSPREGPYLTTTLPHVLAAPMQYGDNTSPGKEPWRIRPKYSGTFISSYSSLLVWFYLYFLT